MTVSQKQAADELLSASYFIPATAFFGISAATSYPVEKNKLALFYTVPVSVVANMGAAFLSTVMGVIDLLAAAVFAAMALYNSGDKTVSGYWMNQAKKIAVVGALLAVGAPIVAAINTVAPFFLRDSVLNYMKGNPDFITNHAGSSGLTSAQVAALHTLLGGQEPAPQIAAAPAPGKRLADQPPAISNSVPQPPPLIARNTTVTSHHVLQPVPVGSSYGIPPASHAGMHAHSMTSPALGRASPPPEEGAHHRAHTVGGPIAALAVSTPAAVPYLSADLPPSLLNAAGAGEGSAFSAPAAKPESLGEPTPVADA